jgi:FtsP/CotA-like multicopper oxidase with cupredoxin domain
MVQFQIMNRQEINDTEYSAAWKATFPGGGGVIDGYGPPLIYNIPNLDGAIGGNPAVTPFIIGPIEPPFPRENGWKDTVIAYPGKVTRIIARWGPQDVAVNAVKPGQNLFGFDPTYGPGYVWHCHIIDHEDNEMMRPYIPTKKADNTFAKFGGELPGIIELLLLFEP